MRIGTAAAAARRAISAMTGIGDLATIANDIMDGDRIRRHRSTAWSQFGVPAAILATRLERMARSF
ncbi:hypothetical protein CEQ30_41095 [Nocardia brasiliensis]|nr:hypothetical protein CEQ30_41095 [Nocardia brasiliensis]